MPQQQHDEVNRILGKLEQGFTSVSGSIASLAVSVNQQFVDIRREIERHTDDDEKLFAELKTGLTDVTFRVKSMEGMFDTVESQGQSILDLENRFEKAEQRLKTDKELAEQHKINEKERAERDRFWIRTIMVISSITLFDKFTGSLLSGWVSTALKVLVH